MAANHTEAAYRKRPGAIIGHARNWGRILDFGHPITIREGKVMLRKIRKGIA